MPDTGGGGKAITRASGISARTRIYFRQNRRQTLVARFSLGKFFEWKKHRSRVRLIAAEEIEPREFDGVENAGGFVCDFRNFVDNRLGPLERSSIRQLRVHDGVTAILRRQKAARQNVETDTGQRK